ncbi:MAG: hypothetical protein DRJ64_03665 [Thermoprotei archaeon]|nr:MAG: hypothetical protein DRJ64_03665 [Thermoprotei archaeon]
MDAREYQTKGTLNWELKRVEVEADDVYVYRARCPFCGKLCEMWLGVDKGEDRDVVCEHLDVMGQDKFVFVGKVERR